MILLAELSRDSRGFRFGELDLIPAEPLATTLAELKSQQLVELAVQNSPQPWRLTLNGWLCAQRVAGYFDSDAFNERRGRLCAAMKKMVKGRQGDVFASEQQIADEAGLPPDWVWNVLRGEVLRIVDPMKRNEFRFQQGSVRIPLTFGQEPVNLD
jgi:hypothetical protein